VKDAFQFQRAVFLGLEALPLVFEDVIPGPQFFRFAGILVLHQDDFPFALEVETHRPVINPVRPVPGQHTAGSAYVIFAPFTLT
jgi:hypothetical protein